MCDLPECVWIEVFSFVPKRDLIILSRVSKKWQQICLDRLLWKNVSVDDFILPEEKVKDDLVKTWLSYGRNVVSLSLKNCFQVSNKSLMTLALGSCRLQHLDLEGCSKITDRGLVTLAKHCTTLKTVNLLDTFVTEHGLCYLISENLNIVELTANAAAVTEETIKVLAGHCKFLKVLQVEQNGPLSQVKVKKQRPEILTTDMVICLAINCSMLHILVMKYPIARLSNIAMAILGHYCKKLECVEFSVLDHRSMISDEGVVNFCLPLTNLRHLELRETEITDVTLHAIAKSCVDIRHLALENCRQLSDLGMLTLLKNCANLESLSLGSGWEGRLTNISAFCIAQSQCAKNLIRLSMHSWDITDFGLFVLSYSLPNLFYLSIEGCNKVTYKGLKESLQSWKNLKSLNLSYTNCVKTDEQLIELTDIVQHLEQLSTYQCNGITASGLNNLKNRLPFCVIESEKIYLI